MLMPVDIRKQICEKFFQEGVLTAMKDIKPSAVHPLVKVRNLYVIKAMRTFVSKGYAREQFAWRCYYWFLTPTGITYLRDFLHLPAEIVPATHMKPKDSKVDAFGVEGAMAQRGPSDKFAYRKGTVPSAPGKAVGEGEVQFRGGFGRGKPM